MPASIVSDLIDLFPDTVTVEVLAFDSFGAVTGVSSLNIRKAHVYGKIRQVRTADGRLVTSTVTAILAGAFGTTVKDRFTLPSRFVPNQPEALAV
jgi:hypothetical protein